MLLYMRSYSLPFGSLFPLVRHWMPFVVGWSSVGPGYLGAGFLPLSHAACSTAGCCCHMHGSCKLASRDSFCCRARSSLGRFFSA
jgi:hypothetical protein